MSGGGRHGNVPATTPSGHFPWLSALIGPGDDGNAGPGIHEEENPMRHVITAMLATIAIVTSGTAAGATEPLPPASGSGVCAACW